MKWKRPVETVMEVAKLRRYDCEEGTHAVVHVKSSLGLTSRWLAIKRRIVQGYVVGEVVLSRHRKRSAAMSACEVDSGRRLKRRRTRRIVER